MKIYRLEGVRINLLFPHFSSFLGVVRGPSSILHSCWALSRSSWQHLRKKNSMHLTLLSLMSSWISSPNKFWPHRSKHTVRSNTVPQYRRCSPSSKKSFPFYIVPSQISWFKSTCTAQAWTWISRHANTSEQRIDSGCGFWVLGQVKRLHAKKKIQKGDENSPSSQRHNVALCCHMSVGCYKYS